MHTNALINPPAAPARSAPGIDAGAEILPLVDAVAGYGPPVIFLAGPGVLLALMLSGAFACLLVLVAVVVVAAAVLVAVPAAILAIVAAPYVLTRRLRSHRARRAPSHRRGAQLVPVGSPRVVA
jgi:membrane protein implicated in regulation of membrane protease activity